jgi:hypothetical protein
VYAWSEILELRVDPNPELEMTLRRNRRAPIERVTIEMGHNIAKNLDPPENVEQPRGENEQPRAENVDYTRSFRDLFALFQQTLLHAQYCHQPMPPIRSKTPRHPTPTLISWLRT